MDLVHAHTSIVVVRRFVALVVEERTAARTRSATPKSAVGSPSDSTTWGTDPCTWPAPLGPQVVVNFVR